MATMRLAVIADVHADLRALVDALDHIAQLGCDEVVCAGDLVSYGAFSEKTVALIAERRIPCVRGNHDHWAARDGRDLTGQELSEQAVRRLGSLPTNLERTVDGIRLAVWHARPGDDMCGIFADSETSEIRRVLDEAAADVLIVGHVHSPSLIDLEGRMIVNPGALIRESPYDVHVGMDGTFGVLELPSKLWGVFRAVDGAEVEITRRSV